MRVKTITCHDVYNYGASLQALALQNYLSAQGHNVEIINYIPKYIKSAPGLLDLDEKQKRYNLFKKNIPLRIIYNLYRLFIYYRTRKRRQAFDRFTVKCLRCTKPYYSLEELRKDCPKADAFVVGSDQVWNSYLLNGQDPAFYLDFGGSDIKRIAYACSFGSDAINTDYYEFTKNQLQRFDAISVREESGVNIVRELGYPNVVHVLDPVFLLSQKEWLGVSTASSHWCIDNYVVIYQIYRDNPSIEQAAQYFKRVYGWKIISIKAYTDLKYVDENIANASPLDFVKIIANSRMVLTDSFHATAFSIILQKQFLVYPNRAVNNNARLLDFCKLIDCSDKIDCEETNIDSISYDWIKVQNLLDNQIKISKHYLFLCLQ